MFPVYLSWVGAGGLQALDWRTNALDWRWTGAAAGGGGSSSSESTSYYNGCHRRRRVDTQKPRDGGSRFGVATYALYSICVPTSPPRGQPHGLDNPEG